MGRKFASDERSSRKAPKGAASASSNDGKNEKLSVFVLLASMDKKPKGSSSAATQKPKPKPGMSSYTNGIDLPPSDEEDVENDAPNLGIVGLCSTPDAIIAFVDRRHFKNEQALLISELLPKQIKE